ncbi:MAG: RNA 2',3'-cyclic phosphodiesterase [Alphaproteobacteria bacterium]|nr:RNA 2',3'-cyclic phosphodiesterase [Alphaproteobacteria bacterium]
MIRLFAGLDIPDAVKEQIQSLPKNLSGALWKSGEKLHLTLRFIGNVEEPVADEIVRTLRDVRFPTFRLGLKELGYFAVGDNPHHLWTGVDDRKAVGELADRIDAAVKKAGGGMNDRFKFMPHVTLAKLQGATLPGVLRYIEQHNLFKSEPWPVESFVLFSSHARAHGDGKNYRIEEQFPLSLV